MKHTGELEAELPNKNLYDFTGNLTQDGKETQPIGPNEVGAKTDFCSKLRQKSIDYLLNPLLNLDLDFAR